MNPTRLQRLQVLKMCESYNRQYGRDYRSVMPTNLYGPEIITILKIATLSQLIRRFHEAKQNNLDEVVVWGSGTPMREFLYVDDMAEASLFVHNLGSIYEICCLIQRGGADVTIKELAEQIKDIVGFHGKLVFDITNKELQKPLWM